MKNRSQCKCEWYFLWLEPNSGLETMRNISFLKRLFFNCGKFKFHKHRKQNDTLLTHTFQQLHTHGQSCLLISLAAFPFTLELFWNKSYTHSKIPQQVPLKEQDLFLIIVFGQFLHLSTILKCNELNVIS